MNLKASSRLSSQSSRPKAVSSGCGLTRYPGRTEDELLKHPTRSPKPALPTSAVQRTSHSPAAFEPVSAYRRVFSARRGTAGQHRETLRTKHASKIPRHADTNEQDPQDTERNISLLPFVHRMTHFLQRFLKISQLSVCQEMTRKFTARKSAISFLETTTTACLCALFRQRASPANKPPKDKHPRN